jgi:hypothetical protein
MKKLILKITSSFFLRVLTFRRIENPRARTVLSPRGAAVGPDVTPRLG